MAEHAHATQAVLVRVLDLARDYGHIVGCIYGCLLHTAYPIITPGIGIYVFSIDLEMESMSTLLVLARGLASQPFAFRFFARVPAPFP